MKTTLWTCSLLACGLLPLAAAEAVALLVFPDDPPQRVWVTAASSTNIEYKVTEASVDRKRLSRSSLDSVYFFEPDSFKAAKKSFRNREYKEAQEQFGVTKKEFERVDDLPGNFSSLSAFYELECARKLGDLDGLAAMLENYLPTGLINEDHKRQAEVYKAWDAVRTKSWPRLKSLTEEMLGETDKWTSSQLAQIYYCRGLALEALKEPVEALKAFNGAFTADFTASDELTRLAALACLRIIDADEEVAVARKLFGTEDEKSNSDGHRLLLEGASLCALWNKALGGGKPLPAEYEAYLKFKKAAAPVTIEKKAEPEKPEPKKAAAPKKKGK